MLCVSSGDVVEIGLLDEFIPIPAGRVRGYRGFPSCREGERLPGFPSCRGAKYLMARKTQREDLPFLPRREGGWY